MDKEAGRNRIEKLIEFFKTLKHKKTETDDTDYSSWDQTEAEYQKQQAEWLKQVKNKKRKSPDK